MKKQLLFIAIACFYSMTITAQVNFGIKAGTTLASYKSSTNMGIIPEYKTIAGFQAGGFVRIGINNFFSVQPELLFSTRGIKSDITQTMEVLMESGYTSYTIKMKSTFSPFYIDLPLHMVASFPSAGSDRFSIGAGPVFSYGAGGKGEIDANINGERLTGNRKLFSKEKLVLKDRRGAEYPDNSATTLLRRFDVGMSGFISYEFSQRVTLSLNYQYGLKNVSDDPDESIKNRCLAITVGYLF